MPSFAVTLGSHSTLQPLHTQRRAASSKSLVAGPLRQFLERVDTEDNQVAKWFFAKWLKQMPGREKARVRNAAARATADTTSDTHADGRHSQEQVQADKGDMGQQTKAPLVPLGEFLSGDNPIVVVMSVLGIFVATQVALHPR